MSMETKIVHKEVRKKAFQNINKIPSHSVFKNYGTGAVEQKQGISTLRELVFCENISFWSKSIDWMKQKRTIIKSETN